MATSKDFNRRQFLQLGAAATGALGTAAFMTGCKNDKDAATNSSDKLYGGTMRFFLTNPVGIDPFSLEEGQGISVSWQLFDTLTIYDFTKQTLDGLAAESWTTSDDERTWTFKLHPGRTFHDGTAVTSESFRYGWTRLVDPTTTEAPSVLAYHLSMVEGYDDLVNGKTHEFKGLSCPDENTFVVKLSVPSSDFAYVCSCPALAPIPEVAAKDFLAFGRAPIGNGPFKMKGQWEDGQSISIVRFEDYKGDKPFLDGVDYIIQKDAQTGFKEFEAGNLDLAPVPTHQVKDAIAKYGEAQDKYTATPKNQVITGSLLYTEYYAINMTNEKFAKPELRQALSLALNRQALCDTFYEGTAQPASDIIPPALEGYKAGTWTYADYNVEKAAQLLDRAGYPTDANGRRNFGFKLLIPTSRPSAPFEAMVADWQAIGIDAVIEQKEQAALFEDVLAGNYDIAARGWYADYPIMDNYLFPLFYTGNGDNVCHLADPEYDRLINEARAEPNKEARIAKYQEANRRVAEIVPGILLVNRAIDMVASDRIAELEVNASQLPVLRKAKMLQS